MNYNVFQTLWRLFGQFRIETYIASRGVTASPPGFHLLNEDLLHIHTHQGRPDGRGHYEGRLELSEHHRQW